MKTINVSAGIIYNDNKILIAQRKSDSPQALKWEFPGGKIEPGEKPENCLKREIKEELDIEILVGNQYMIVSHFYEQEKQVVLLCYFCQYLSGIPKTKECHNFKWVNLQELKEYDFAEADIPVVNKLLKEKHKCPVIISTGH